MNMQEAITHCRKKAVELTASLLAEVYGAQAKKRDLATKIVKLESDEERLKRVLQHRMDSDAEPDASFRMMQDRLADVQSEMAQLSESMRVLDIGLAKAMKFFREVTQ